jgi:hypothetical protein
MMCTVKSLCVVCAVGILLIGAAVACADTVTIDNASFESADLSVGEVWGVADVPPSWMTTRGSGAGCGYYDVVHYGWFTQAPPDGGKQALAFGAGNNLCQVLTATLAANTKYTLTMDAGAGLPWAFGNADFTLGYGNYSVVTDLAPATSSEVAPAQGYWSPWQKTFVTGANPDGLGQTLRIDVGGGGTFAFVDNIRLDAAPVPEPATLTIVCTGLIGLLCYAWRKRR